MYEYIMALLHWTTSSLRVDYEETTSSAGLLIYESTLLTPYNTIPLCVTHTLLMYYTVCFGSIWDS